MIDLLRTNLMMVLIFSGINFSLRCCPGIQFVCGAVILKKSDIYKIWGFAWWKSVSSRFAVSRSWGTGSEKNLIAQLVSRLSLLKWEIWFRENHGDFTGFFSTFRLACSNLRQENEEVWRCSSLSSICWDYVLNGKCSDWCPVECVGVT